MSGRLRYLSDAHLTWPRTVGKSEARLKAPECEGRKEKDTVEDITACTTYHVLRLKLCTRPPCAWLSALLSFHQNQVRPSEDETAWIDFVSEDAVAHFDVGTRAGKFQVETVEASRGSPDTWRIGTRRRHVAPESGSLVPQRFVSVLFHKKQKNEKEVIFSFLLGSILALVYRNRARNGVRKELRNEDETE